MWILRDIIDPEFQKVCGMNSFHGKLNSFHGGMNSDTRWNEFIPGGMNSFYSRVSYTAFWMLNNIIKLLLGECNVNVRGMLGKWQGRGMIGNDVTRA